MFEHSVRVPRNYKIAANIFKKVSTEGGSVKSLLYDDKLKHFRTNVLYALINETIKHAADLDKNFENCKLLINEPRLDPWLAKVLTAELLYGKKKLPGQSKPEQTILSYKEQFEKFMSENEEVLKTEVRRPRYVRINTNLLTTSDAIRAFQDEGYKFIRCTSGSYDDYLEQIKNLTEYDFTQDYHVKTVFVFSSGTKLHEHDLYLGNKIILQDKATAMAVHLLAPPPGAVALDMCAAPGMKTTQLAAYIRNQGKIYAIERSEQRYQTLCDFVEKTGSKCVKTINMDSLEIKRGDYDDVEYILLDPSCSGSGMELCVHNYIDPARLSKLTSLQEKFLKHAMNAFPNAKRIVYSTCSLYPEENERVITNIVKNSRAKWRVQEVKELLKGQWNNFGSGMYGSIGARCMYARPDSDLTTGFFLAVLDKDQKEDKGNKAEEGKSEVDAGISKKKSKNEDHDIELEVNATADVEVVAKKKKRKHKDKVTNGEGIDVNGDFNEEDSRIVEVEAMDIESPKKKKKKNKNRDMDAIEIAVEETTDETKTKKKKKRKVDPDSNIEEVVDSVNDVSISKKKNNKKTEIPIEDEHVDNNKEGDDVTKKKKKKHKKHDAIEA